MRTEIFFGSIGSRDSCRCMTEQTSAIEVLWEMLLMGKPTGAGCCTIGAVIITH
jgi:hypothetical protein